MRHRPAQANTAPYSFCTGVMSILEATKTGKVEELCRTLLALSVDPEKIRIALLEQEEEEDGALLEQEEEKDGIGNTRLHFAASFGHLECVQEMLKHREISAALTHPYLLW